MGATCWSVGVPWQEDLEAALAEARAAAYADLPASQRARVENLTDDQLLLHLELDPDDDPDTWDAWAEWLRTVSPETRYAVAFLPMGGTGSVLDVDRVEHQPAPRRAPALVMTTGLRLQPPKPGLGVVRPATAEEQVDWFDEDHRSTIAEDVVFGALARGEAVAVICGEGARRIVFFGVTGD